MTITFEASADAVSADELAPFFVGWPTPPSPARRCEILRAATEAIVARADDGQLVGFVTAITDGTFAASIPLLEVHPDWQGQGIGRQLMAAMLDRLRSCYMIDLACDDEVVGFYARLGATRVNAMVWRNRDRIDP